ncbi:hypothetical protein [Olivibacter sp. XZL3]|uniref:type IV toxin-antitoxin system AbiEi family antitoxin domain-containing protein n=1 Tax=Olivibacter sp. XZL3 TaxID=1735116 RepID=UPI0010653F11|nr:hypothetical protein [Olivibacter sp. XZL3]
MNIHQLINKYAQQPLPHQLLVSWLGDYKRPNDKINTLKTEGVLEAVKKGLYIAGPATGLLRPEPFLLANHMLGPSYVSIETALSYYGLIPERVYEVASMTTKASRKFDTSLGRFTYTHLPLPYYAFGLNCVQLSPDQVAIIASPEKALCDKIVTTAGLTLRSIKGSYDYLVDGMRIEESALKQLNVYTIEEWLPGAPKKDSLLMLVKMIKSL